MAPHALDTKAVVIGSSTKDGRKFPPPLQARVLPSKKQAELVEIWAGPQCVGEMELSVLKRFSGRAATYFSNSATGAADKNVEGPITASVKGNTARTATKQVDNSNPVKRVINLEHVDFWSTPSAAAILAVMAWMNENKSAPRWEKLESF